MPRQLNTTRVGGAFDQVTINAVWSKGQAVPGQNPAINRKDACGAWMVKSHYGTTGDYGWEIDHIKPVAAGGTDDLNNLQPLQWRNNRHKADNYPNWACAIRAAS